MIFCCRCGSEDRTVCTYTSDNLVLNSFPILWAKAKLERPVQSKISPRYYLKNLLDFCFFLTFWKDASCDASQIAKPVLMVSLAEWVSCCTEEENEPQRANSQHGVTSLGLCHQTIDFLSFFFFFWAQIPVGFEIIDQRCPIWSLKWTSGFHSNQAGVTSESQD